MAMGKVIYTQHVPIHDWRILVSQGTCTNSASPIVPLAFWSKKEIMCSSLNSAFPVLGRVLLEVHAFSMGVNSMCSNCILTWCLVLIGSLKFKVRFNKPDPNHAKGITTYYNYIQLPSTSQEDLLISSVSCSWIGSLASFTAFRRSRKERRPEPELSKRRNLGVSVNHNQL